MNTDRRSPCVSCPYRKDARLAFWHAEHFKKLLSDDKEMFGPLYQCHEDGKKPNEERGLCVGWMLDQRRRNVPALLLRLKLMDDPALATQLEAVTDGGASLFPTVERMCLANLAAIARGRKTR